MLLSEYVEELRAALGRLPVIGFVGAGISNLAVAKKLSGGCTVLRDRGGAEDPEWERIKPDKVFLGGGYLEGIFEDILFLSPSVRRDDPKIMEAARRGVIICSDAELFFSGNDRAVYAVSGSDGKSTTATLAHLLLSERYPDAELLGNIGVPFAASRKTGVAVAELSSFQLEYLSARVRAAIITCITPNHLDWHVSYDEYIAAKQRIFDGAWRKVISPDTPICEKIASNGVFSVLYSAKYTHRELSDRFSASHTVSLEGDYITVDGVPQLSTKDCKRRERHNIHNLMGAMSLTLGEYSREHLCSVAEGFGGLAHRMEYLYSRSGIEFINSSIDTTPARTRATLEALGKRVRIILGGRGKGLSLLPCVQALKKYAVRISLYGEAGADYYRELFDTGITCQLNCRLFTRFDDAVDHAAAGATKADTVLLSPAATGYGEFKNFEERGMHFKDYIKDL